MRAFPTSRRISPRSTTPQSPRAAGAAATTDSGHTGRSGRTEQHAETTDAGRVHGSVATGARRFAAGTGTDAAPDNAVTLTNSATTESPDRSRHPLARAAVLAAAASMVFSVGVAFAPSSGATITTPIAPEYAPARTGILQAVAAYPDPALIPDDFVTQAGYRPVVEAGMLINPNGDCSSPVPLPAEFDLACKSHDLGYDLLRYAAAHGQPLGPWARQTVDAALERRMHAACTDRAGAFSRAQCDVMASVATTAVDLNSIRQDYGDPIYEPFFEPSAHSPSEATMLLGGVGVSLLSACTATVLIRRRRRAVHAPGSDAGKSATSIATVAR